MKMVKQAVAVVLWCAVAVGCVAEPKSKTESQIQKQIAEIKAANSEFEDVGQLLMIKNMDGTGLCNWLHDYLNTGKKMKELSKSVKPLEQFGDITFPKWDLVNGVVYEAILYESASNDSKYNDGSEQYRNWKDWYDSVGGHKFYLAKLNFDNQGEDEFILKYEVNEEKIQNGKNKGRYFVLEDENKIYPHFRHTGYGEFGRLFFYKGSTYVLIASSDDFADIVSIARPENTGSQTAAFNFNKTCILSSK